MALFIAINVGIHAMASFYEAETTNLIFLYVGRSYVIVSEGPASSEQIWNDYRGSNPRRSRDQ